MQPFRLIRKSIPVNNTKLNQIKQKGRLTKKKVSGGHGCKRSQSNGKEENVELGDEVSNLSFDNC